VLRKVRIALQTSASCAWTARAGDMWKCDVHVHTGSVSQASCAPDGHNKFCLLNVALMEHLYVCQYVCVPMHNSSRPCWLACVCVCVCVNERPCTHVCMYAHVQLTASALALSKSASLLASACLSYKKFRLRTRMCRHRNM
jgi:hypothetical protein